MNTETQNDNDNQNGSHAKLTFGLHPGRTLNISLLSDVKQPAEISEKIASFIGCDSIDPKATNSEQSNTKHRFAILSADRIVSVNHIAIAANSALFREYQRQSGSSASTASAGNDQTSSASKQQEPAQNSSRGVAVETVFCAGGSLNVGNVLKEFGFHGNDAKNTTSNVLALGFDCTDLEMDNFINLIGGSPLSLSYLSRNRTDDEIKDLIKAFKLSKTEIGSFFGSLEDAVVSRVATKHFS